MTQLDLLPVTTAERRCATCEKPITPRRRWGRFCSSRCRLGAWVIRRGSQAAPAAALTQAGGASAPVLLPEPPRRARTAVLRHAFFPSHVPPAEAIARDQIAGRQEAEVLAVFRSAADDADEDDFDAARLTPSQVHECLKRNLLAFPLLTSVRRAITNLTTRGLLRHHPADRRPGPYGAKESTWSLA